MDGNGRWAKSKGLIRSAGHERGGHQVREILRAAHDLGVRQLTLYAFSTENWKRPKAEVQFLMNLLTRFLRSERDQLNKDNVHFKTIGELQAFPKRVLNEIDLSKELLKNNTGIVLCLALNYGSRNEIVRATSAMAKDILAKPELADRIDEELLDSYMDTAGMPELDLLIRTAGEQRLSNFLLWQMHYAEMLFTPKYWPDFSPEDLREAVETFGSRERRFGGLESKRGSC